MILSLFSYLFLASGIVVHAQNSVSVSDCNTGSLFQITKLGFEPTNPIPGENGTLFVDYNVPNQVTSGSVLYKCNYNGLPVYSETFDLCSQTVCPIESGLHSDNSISPVPNANGKVICTIQWSDTNNQELLCIRMTLKLATAAV
jgi:hypothetical protein